MPVSKNFELANLASGLDVDQSTGEVLTINLDTDVVTEGSANVYYTDARVAAFLSGGTFTGGIKLGDNEKLQFGDTTTPDLEIYHDTNNSIIADTGTGNLVLDSETVVVQSTGALVVPVGTTLQQPTTLLQGMVRYNTDDSTFEGYDGAAWGSLGGVKDVDQDTYIEAEEGVDDDTLRFYTAGDIALTIDSIQNAKFESIGAVRVPVGSEADKTSFTAEQGQIRYNTTDSTFEGYDGAAWGSLGGVKDVDQDTKIEAESSAGADNDQLDFYTAGIQRMQIGATGDLGFGDSLTKFTVAFTSGDTNIAGTLDVSGAVNLNNTTGSTSATTGALVIDGGTGIAENLYVGGNIDVTGDLTVNGTTTTVNSTVVTVDDPIFTLGGDTAPTTDDNKDRGIEFRWHDGTANTAAGSFVIGVEYVIITSGDTDFTLIGAADSNPGTVFTATGAGDALTTGTALATSAQKLGFFGYDDSIGQFTFIPDATNASEVFSGTSGDVTFGNGTFDGTSAVKVPVGTTAQRPGEVGVPQSVAQGQIRYNTSDSTFEGYDGANWGSLGGIKDVDQDTYITAEETADDDTLRFYTAGTERMTIGSTGDVNLAGNLIFEGATADDFETTLTVVDPTADRTITLPDATGNVITTGNLTEITNLGVLTGDIVFEGATDDAFETTLTVTDPTADRTITFQDASGTVALLSDISGGGSASFSTVNLTGDIVFEGATADDFETTLTVTDPTADRTITLPDASGTVAISVTDTTTTTQGDLNLDFTLSAAGDVSATGDAHGLSTSDSPTFAGLTINGSSVVFEGSTADDFETTITASDPTADRTITLPDATGNVITTGNLTEITNLGVLTGDIVFEGATDDTFETTLTVTDPTADRTITLPDASGTVAVSVTDTTTTTQGDLNLDFTLSAAGDISATGDAHGLASTDSPTFAGLTINGSSIILEGATADDFETTLTVTDPTADRTITFPDATGTVLTTGNFSEITNLGVLTGDIVFEGATSDDFETTLTVVDPAADRTITLPDASGTVPLLSVNGLTSNVVLTSFDETSINGVAINPSIAQSNAHRINISSGTFQIIQQYNTGVPGFVDPSWGNIILNGDVYLGGGTSFDNFAYLYFNGPIKTDLVFEGSTDDNFETTLTLTDPTADRTITLPDATGNVITTGNLTEITNLGVLTGGITFEGSTDDTFETTLTVTDPTADRIVTIPDQSGTVLLDSLGGQTVSSTFTVQGNSNLNYPSYSTMLQVENTGSGTTALILANDTSSERVTLLNVDGDFLIQNGFGQKAFRFSNGESITFEGATDDTFETTLTVTDPTVDRTITFPDASGNVILTNTEDSAKTITVIDNTASAFQFSATGKAGILKIDSTNTAEGVAMSGYLTVDGNATFNGNTTIGDANTDTVTFTAKANSSLLFDADGTYNIGDATNRVNEVHADYGEIDQWIDFGTGIGHPAHQEGRVWYDNIHRTFNYYSDDPNVVHELGIEEHQRVYNNTGSTILKGQPLYFSGNYVSGSIDVPTVGLADATDVNAYNAQGLAASDIASGSYGYCIIAGQIHDVDTSGLNANTNFFVGLTPGAVQNASPTYPNYPMCLGWVVKSDPTNGVLLVNQQNHSVNSFRVRTSAHIGSDLQVDGDLTVLGTTTSVSTADVTAGAPFYRANEGDSIGEAGTTFIGTGLDDAFFSGHFTGTQSTTYYVRIDSVGTPDTFEVSLDNFASTLSTGNAMTGSNQLIHSADNIYVEFGATTGHTLGDVWQGTAGPTNVDTGFFSNRNTGTSGVGYTHVGIFFDVSDEKWKLVDEYDPTPAGTINTGDASFSTGTLVAGAVEANVDWSYIQNKPDPTITTTLTGTVTGTGNATLTDLTNGTISIATSIPGTTNLTLADLTVTNLTVNGTQTINNQTNLTSDDPLFVLNQSQNGEPDIGMIGGYTENSTAQYTGFFRDASDNKWKLFDGYTPNVTSTGSINVSDASFALTTLVADTFEGNLDWSYIQNKPDPVVTVTLTGEVTGTGNTTLTDLASGTISIATNIDPNSDVEVNDLTVTGDLNVQGTTTTVNQTTLTVSDSKIFLADGNNADVIDIGTIFEYNDGSNDQSAGLFRDANDSGKFKFFDTYTLTVGTTIDTAHASFSLGTVVADTFEGNFTGTLTGNISGTATSAATLTTARNLWGQSFDGSADISGNLTSVGNITGTSAVEIIAGGTNQNIVTTPSGTGYTILGGNVGIGNSVPSEKLEVTGNILVNGNLIFEGATADTFETTLTVTDPTADRTVTIPDVDGKVALITGTDSDIFDLGSYNTSSAGLKSSELRFDSEVYISGTVNTNPLDEMFFRVGPATTPGYIPLRLSPGAVRISKDATLAFGNSILYTTNITTAAGSANHSIVLPAVDGTVLTTGNLTEITNLGVLTGDIVFEGATDDAFETTLTVTDPTADRTITLPDASGDVLLQDSTTGLFNITASSSGTSYFYNSGAYNYLSIQNSVSGSGANTGLIMGATTQGDAVIAQRISNGGSIYFNTDDSGGTYATRVTIGDTDLTLHQNMQLVFEGASADSFETTVTVTDPTADRTITLPDTTGNVITTGNLTEITNLGVLTGDIVFEGATDDAFETTLTVTDPTADRTITIPDADGTLMLNLVEDTTPQLGGTLDAQGQDINNVGSLQIDSAYQLNSITVASIPASGASVQTLGSATTFRTAKLLIQSRDLTTGHTMISEVLLAHDGTTVHQTVYGEVNTTTAPFATYDCTISGGNINIQIGNSGSNAIKTTITTTMVLT